jgi:acyl-CoA synthetase (AMP-forming)/AMP-acid ligase II/thioesterase domain-containing protein
VRLIYSERAESELLTYPALLQEARRILGGLQAYGRPPGTKVALLLEHSGDFIPAFWACILGGFVPCALVLIRNDAVRWEKHLDHVNMLLDRPILVTTASLKKHLPEEMTTAELEVLRRSVPLESAQISRPEEPAIIILTSGSTGNAKGVVLTHSNVLASMAGKAERRKLTSDDIALNWVPFDHVTALLESHMLAVFVGATWIHVAAAAILADPLLFLRLIDRYRVSTGLAPNFLIGQINVALGSLRGAACDRWPLPLDLSCVRHIITGGEANVVETGRRFLDLLAPNGLIRNALWPGFGMTETCAGVAYSAEFPDIDAEREFASVGFPINGFQMRIVDEQGALSPAGEAGELQLRGPMIFSQYHNNEEATRTAFTADGWFRTGDLARIEQGRLNLVGRNKDCIIVSGVNYFSHELEAVLEQLEGVEQSFVAAFPTRPKGADTEQLVVSFATSFPLEDEGRLHQLTVALRNTTILLWGFRPALILPLPKTAFPKTSLGKIQRSLMRKRLESGDFAANVAHIAEVTTRQMGGYTAPASTAETALANIYAEMFGLDPAALSTTASFFDLGGTSLEIIQLTRRIAVQFGVVDVPMATILQNPTVRALAARIAPAEGRRRNEYDPVVPLQLTGHKTPLFCVHPAIGEILVFVNLAKYFVNERPFYALRTRGFNEGEEYFGTLDEMVRTYVDAIRRVQPQGPYAIAGYSFGGMAAFEIAKMLESLGERVIFCCSIDMPPRTIEPISPDYCAISLAFFLSLIEKEQMLELHDRFRASDPDLCEHLVRIAAPERLAELNLDLPKFKDWAALAYSLSTVGKSYVPSGTVESVTVLYSRPRWGTMQDWLNNQLRRWDDFTRASNRYVEVAGEHHSLMGPEYVATFQAILRAELDRALGGT